MIIGSDDMGYNEDSLSGIQCAKYFHLQECVDVMRRSEVQSKLGRKIFRDNFNKATGLLIEIHDIQEEMIEKLKKQHGFDRDN